MKPESNYNKTTFKALWICFHGRRFGIEMELDGVAKLGNGPRGSGAIDSAVACDQSYAFKDMQPLTFANYRGLFRVVSKFS